MPCFSYPNIFKNNCSKKLFVLLPSFAAASCIFLTTPKLFFVSAKLSVSFSCISLFIIIMNCYVLFYFICKFTTII